MTGTNDVGQAVGGVSAVAGGTAVLGAEIAMLPDTGMGLNVFSILPYLAIILGVVVLTSLVVSRLMRNA